MVENYRKYFPLAGGIALLLVVWLTFFTVRETEFVLVTQFGQPLYTVADAGLHVKWPFQTANYFDRRLRVYNPRPSEFLTRDKKNLVVESYVAWKIQDPKRFVETVGDPIGAEMRLHDIVWSGLSAALGTHDLETIVSTNLQTVKADEMLDQLSALTDRAALQQYGIEVVDVRVKRLNLPEQNKQSVYARMRAERERIARQYRAEGEEQALSIRADADRQKEEILSVVQPRQQRAAVREHRGERAQLARLDLRHRGPGRRDREVHAPGKQIDRERRVALVRHLHDVELLHLLQLSGHQDAGAVPRAVVELPRIGARIRDQLGRRVRGHARVRKKEESEETYERHRSEVRYRIVGRGLARCRHPVERGVGRVEQRVAVGGGFRHQIGGDHAVAARLRLHDHRLAERLSQRL